MPARLKVRYVLYFVAGLISATPWMLALDNIPPNHLWKAFLAMLCIQTFLVGMIARMTRERPATP